MAGARYSARDWEVILIKVAAVGDRRPYFVARIWLESGVCLITSHAVLITRLYEAEGIWF